MGVKAFFATIQTFGSFLQMWQLCLALSLYTDGMLAGEHTDSVQEFENWMLIEILGCLSTIVTSILSLALRQLAPKPSLEL